MTCRRARSLSVDSNSTVLAFCRVLEDVAHGLGHDSRVRVDRLSCESAGGACKAIEPAPSAPDSIGASSRDSAIVEDVLGSHGDCLAEARLASWSSFPEFARLWRWLDREVARF
jgi:hypothetical protein